MLPSEKAIERSLLISRCLVGTIMLILGIALIHLEKPWEIGISERLAKGRFPKLDDIIDEGFWYAALINCFLCLGLMVTSRVWSRPYSVSSEPQGKFFTLGKSKSWARALFAISLAGAITLGALERWPKMDQSFTNDEEYAFRRLIFGQFAPEEDGRLSNPELLWKETFFNNRASNNHIIFSVLSRVCHDFCIWVSGEDAAFVSERAARMPSFFAGLLSIFLVGLIPALVGLPRAGVASAFLLALNPWHLRYATEARGYSLMIFFILLATCALILAVGSGRRRYWGLYAASQSLYLLTFPGALHLVVATNILAVVAIARTIPAADWRSGKWRAHATPFWHLAAANVFSCIAFLQIFSPSVRQLTLFLDQRAATGPMGWDWLRDVWSHLTAGMRWEMDDRSNPLFLSIQHSIESTPTAAVFFFILMPAAVIIGLVRSFAGSPPRMLLVAPTFLAGIMAFAHIFYASKFLYAWYVIYAVIGVVLGTALGVDGISSIKPKCGRFASLNPDMTASVCLILFLLGYALHTVYPRKAMVTIARQPIREAVLVAHGPLHSPHNPEPRELLTAAIGTSARQKFTYDPRIIPLEMEDDKALPRLAQLIEKADAANLPLRVLICNPALVEKETPKVFSLLTGSSPESTLKKFRVVQTITGLEAMFTYVVCEYNSGLP